MIYAIIGALVVSFYSGWGVAWHNDKQAIAALNMAIATQKESAQAQLDNLTGQLAQKEIEAVDLNKNLEKSHVATIESINTLHDSLKPVRLYDRGTSRSSSHCAVSKTSDTGQPKEHETSGSELSAELTEFLKSESYRADQLTADYNSLVAFVSAKCGVQ